MSRSSLQVLRGSFLLMAILIFSDRQAHAATVTVGCAGASGSFNFSTITDALTSLAGSGKSGHTIIISGKCTESLFLEGWDHLQLVGTPGATLVASRAPFAPALNIVGSEAITISGLAVQGTGTGPSDNNPAIIADSTVGFSNCTIENGGGGATGGVFILGVSRVRILQSIIQNNQPQGIRVDPGADLELGAVDPVAEPTSSVVRGNTIGVVVFSGGHADIFGSTVIQNNNLFGIFADAGSVRLCCEQGQRQIINNGVGVILANGSTLQVNGPALLQGNTQFGLLLNGSSAAFLFNGGQKIQQNGTPGNSFSGGILARFGSQLDLSVSGEVVNNIGPGLVVRNNSSARISNQTITGNGGAGVSVFILSSAEVFGNTISGNGEADLRCSPDSFASGNRAGIQKLFCPNFNVEPLPGPKP